MSASIRVAAESKIGGLRATEGYARAIREAAVRTQIEVRTPALAPFKLYQPAPGPPPIYVNATLGCEVHVISVSPCGLYWIDREDRRWLRSPATASHRGYISGGPHSPRTALKLGPTALHALGVAELEGRLS